jgi:hypothetical protein
MKKYLILILLIPLIFCLCKNKKKKFHLYENSVALSWICKLENITDVKFSQDGYTLIICEE